MKDERKVVGTAKLTCVKIGDGMGCHLELKTEDMAAPVLMIKHLLTETSKQIGCEPIQLAVQVGKMAQKGRDMKVEVIEYYNDGEEEDK